MKQEVRDLIRKSQEKIADHFAQLNNPLENLSNKYVVEVKGIAKRKGVVEKYIPQSMHILPYLMWNTNYEPTYYTACEVEEVKKVCGLMGIKVKKVHTKKEWLQKEISRIEKELRKLYERWHYGR